MGMGIIIMTKIKIMAETMNRSFNIGPFPLSATFLTASIVYAPCYSIIGLLSELFLFTFLVKLQDIENHLGHYRVERGRYILFYIHIVIN